MRGGRLREVAATIININTYGGVLLICEASCAQIVQDKIGQRRLNLEINKFTLCITLLIEFSLYFHLKTLWMYMNND